MSRMSQYRSLYSAHGFALCAVAALCLGLTGCTALVSPINALPANRVPDAFLGTARANEIPINLARLRIEKPKEYSLDSGDILAISIESILGQEGEAPPVAFPQPGSDLPPAIGYPFPVTEEGSIILPLIDPIPVRGLTLQQVRESIRKAYMEENDILQEDRIIVTLMRKRTVRVIVIRQDSDASAGLGQGFNQQGGGANRVNQRSDQSGRGTVLDLPADEADLMHALAQTGGLPGINAKNEVMIQRGDQRNFAERDQFMLDFYKENYESGDPCHCPPPMPGDPSILRIPLRLPPGQVPSFTQEDIRLHDGDIVFVEARDAEVYYAGGLLRGGEYPLPRDYDLDVLGAIALTGGSIGAPNLGGIGGGNFVNGAPPQQLIVLRKTPCNGQVAIEVDLHRAINDPSYRILVQPGDTLILRYRPVDEAINFGLGTFFTYGIAELLGRGGR
jgi:hypothetical protein